MSFQMKNAPLENGDEVSPPERMVNLLPPLLQCSIFMLPKGGGCPGLAGRARGDD